MFAPSRRMALWIENVLPRENLAAAVAKLIDRYYELFLEMTQHELADASVPPDSRNRKWNCLVSQKYDRPFWYVPADHDGRCSIDNRETSIRL